MSQLSSIIFVLLASLTAEIFAYSIQKRIVGGEYSLHNDFPYQVSLRRYKYYKWSQMPYTENFCGGAIISDRWIITAAYCTKNFVNSPRDLLIGYGVRSFEQITPMHRAMRIVQHPNFGKTSFDSKDDIALVQTKVAIQFGKNVQPIKLAREWVDNNKLATVSGFGLLENGEIAEYLRWTHLRTIKNSECAQTHGYAGGRFHVHTSLVCGFYRSNVGICDGDSGDPLVSFYDKRLIGIALMDERNPCAIGKPDLFTRISFYVDWIWEITNVTAI